MVTDLIVGRYEILEELGEKKKAIDRLTGREVVVCAKPPEACPQEELLERLVRLRHPNLAAFVHHFPLDGELWMVTEFVDGASLESLLGASQPFEGAHVRTWMRGMAEGTQATHAANLLVGELSPSKVIVGEDGAVKILDAGFSGLAAGPSGIQNELATLAAIYRRILGEAANANPALTKMEAAQSSEDFLAAVKEIEVAAPVPQGAGDRKPVPRRKRKILFRNWNKRVVIAIVATLIGIAIGFRIALHGEAPTGLFSHFIERTR